jgi:hypothetical protein
VSGFICDRRGRRCNDAARLTNCWQVKEKIKHQLFVSLRELFSLLKGTGRLSWPPPQVPVGLVMVDGCRSCITSLRGQVAGLDTPGKARMSAGERRRVV